MSCQDMRCRDRGDSSKLGRHGPAWVGGDFAAYVRDAGNDWFCVDGVGWIRYDRSECVGEPVAGGLALSGKSAGFCFASPAPEGDDFEPALLSSRPMALEAAASMGALSLDSAAAHWLTANAGGGEAQYRELLADLREARARRESAALSARLARRRQRIEPD